MLMLGGFFQNIATVLEIATTTSMLMTGLSGGIYLALRGACLSDKYCKKDMSCQRYICKSVSCLECGSGTVCQIENHQATCQCQAGLVATSVPTRKCVACLDDSYCKTKEACWNGHCQPVRCKPSCGNNSQCKVKNHIGKCRCKIGFVGDPIAGCVGTCDIEIQLPALVSTVTYTVEGVKTTVTGKDSVTLKGLPKNSDVPVSVQPQTLPITLRFVYTIRHDCSFDFRIVT